MEVQEAQKRRRELEKAISDLISQFQTETGCAVQQVLVGKRTMTLGCSMSERPRMVSPVIVEVSL